MIAMLSGGVAFAALLCAALIVFGSAADGARVRVNARRPLAGGWSNADKTSPEIQKAAQAAVGHIEVDRNSPKALRLQQIHSASSQVVSGMNYKLKVQIGTTDCQRGDNSANLDSCGIEKVQNCTAFVWVQSWQNRTQVTNYTCGRLQNPSAGTPRPRPRPGGVPGGLTNVDVNSENVQQAARFASTALSAKTNGEVQLNRVVEAKQQVVAGMVYHLKIEVNVSGTGNRSQKTRCNVKVWEQSWRNPALQLQEYNCARLIPNETSTVRSSG